MGVLVLDECWGTLLSHRLTAARSSKLGQRASRHVRFSRHFVPKIGFLFTVLYNEEDWLAYRASRCGGCNPLSFLRPSRSSLRPRVELSFHAGAVFFHDNDDLPPCD